MAKRTKPVQVESLAQLRERLSRKGAEELNEELAYVPRDLVMFGLPHRQWKGPGPYKRRAGRFELVVTGGELGVPYGMDRHIFILLATAYVALGCPEDRIIRARSASDLLEVFGQAKGGWQMRTFRQRIERVLDCHFLIIEHTEASRLKRRAYKVLSGVDLWFERGGRGNQYSLWPNVMKLDADFAEMVREAQIPTPLNFVRDAGSNFTLLDLGLWEMWRSFILLEQGRRLLRVPMFGPKGLCAQIGMSFSTEREGRRRIIEAHEMLRQKHWPECPNSLSTDGKFMELRPGRILRCDGHAQLGQVVTTSKDPRLPPVEKDWKPEGGGKARLLKPWDDES